ncbi:peptidylprolyl isomerase, partial [Mycobacterium sp. THU-M116]
MPTNEQRRATAKRKLERQLARRAKQARMRRILVIAAGAVVSVAVITALALAVVNNRHEHDSGGSTAAPATTTTMGSPAQTTTTATAPQTAAVPPLPPFTPSANLGADCQYPATGEPAAKDVKPPRTGKVSTEPAQVSASMMTNQGPVGLMLANNESPCTVNSFASLAQQKYFDGTQCHRLTTSPTLGVLQCGDPTAKGTGGPGYQFANEYPTDQYPPNDPKLDQPVLYPRGTLAMANAGPGTNGSQFFLVYKDSELPPKYTVFGTIQADGLATLDKIA